MKHLGTAAVIVGLAAYAVAFYATPLPSVRGDAGQPLLRIELLVQLLLWPKEWLFSNWFGTPPQCALLDRLPVLLIAGVIVAWATVVGWLLMVLCRADRGLGRLELAVFATAVGLNALSTWVLLLGLFGVLDRLWTFTVPAFLTLGLACHSWRNSRRLTAAGNSPAGCCDGALSAHWLWLAAPFVLAILLAAMLPPLDFDVREYHLQAPKEFFQQGQITFLPHNVYANMALGTEMLSLLAMVISGDWWLGALAGKTVIAVFTLLCGLGLLAAGRRLFSPTAGVVAAVVYLSIPWVTSIASGGFVEGASACYLFLALYALLLPRSSRGGNLLGRQLNCRPDAEVKGWQYNCHSNVRVEQTSSLLLAGYLAGGAVSTKYPALLFVLLPLAVGVLLSRPRARAARACGVFLLAAAVGCGLWFAKNGAETGNPTHPLFYSVFDGKTWSVEKERQWNAVHRPHDFSAGALGKDLGRIAMTSEWLSPLVMPLAALALVGWRARRGRVVWILLSYAGFVIAVWWLATHRIDRFWIPVLPVLALLAGAGACWSAARWWRRLLVALLLAGAGANFLVAAAGQGNTWFVGLARLRHDPGWIDPWHEYFNTHLAQGRLLMVGDAAVFDLTRPVLYNTCFDDCIFEQLVKGRTAAEIRAGLAARQISYVYVDWGEIARYRRTYGFTNFVKPQVFDRLVAEGILEPLPAIEGHEGRGYRVKRGT
jgi:hypothetical protein